MLIHSSMHLLGSRQTNICSPLGVFVEYPSDIRVVGVSCLSLYTGIINNNDEMIINIMTCMFFSRRFYLITNTMIWTYFSSERRESDGAIGRTSETAVDDNDQGMYYILT